MPVPSFYHRQIYSCLLQIMICFIYSFLTSFYTLLIISFREDIFQECFFKEDFSFEKILLTRRFFLREDFYFEKIFLPRRFFFRENSFSLNKICFEKVSFMKIFLLKIFLSRSISFQEDFSLEKIYFKSISFERQILFREDSFPFLKKVSLSRRQFPFQADYLSSKDYSYFDLWWQDYQCSVVLVQMKHSH